ncbi:hypothetical protein D049_1423A, partial [Vibrio parahaemolyticus VPTS-2010]|jgi:hypothetical protein
MVSN